MLSGKTGAQPLQHLRVQSGRTWERARQADNFLPLEYGKGLQIDLPLMTGEMTTE